MLGETTMGSQPPAPYASALSLARGTRLAADITGGSVSARGLKRAFEKPRSGRQGRHSWRVQVPLPSIARFGRLAYPLLGEVTNRDMRGRKSHRDLG